MLFSVYLYWADRILRLYFGKAVGVVVDRVKAPPYNRLGGEWLECLWYLPGRFGMPFCADRWHSSNASFLRLGMNASLGFLLLGIGWQVDLALRGN